MNKVIIAPFSMHKDLLSQIRKDNPFLKCKIITKEDLISQVFGEFSLESRIELMKKMNITYDLASELVSYLPFIYKKSNERINDLLDVKGELISNGHYVRNDLIDIAFKDAEFEIYGYSPLDKLLLEALNRINRPYSFIEGKKDLPDIKLIRFEKVEDEVFYVLNSVASLIDQGISPDDIYLYNVDETYGYYLSLYQDSFNIKINNLPRPNMFLSNYASDFFKLFEESHDVNDALLKLEEAVGKEKGDDVDFMHFKEVILANIYQDITYEMQKDILTSVLKQKNFKCPYYKNGIKVINQPVFVSGKHIFVMCFALNIVPRVYKDDAYFSNLEKEDTFIEKSTDLTLIDKDLALEFLNTYNHFYYSYSLYSSSNKYYPSSFVVDHDNQITDIQLPTTIYSQKMLDYNFAQRMDLFLKYLEDSSDFYALGDICDIPYRKYDNSYTGVYAIDNDTDITYSYTSINLYKSCPFAYYLNYVLKFEDFEDTFTITAGNIIHKTFEHIHEKNYDFEASYNEAIKEHNFSAIELIRLEKIKKQLEIARDTIQNHFNQDVNKRSAKYELETSYKIDNHSSLYGKVDKIITLDAEHYMVIDYKSSVHSFDKSYLHEGIGLQLPIYYVLLSEDMRFKDLKIAGLYYQQVIDKKFDPFISELDDSINYLKFEGVTITNNVNISLIDYTLSGPNAKSEYVNGLSLDKNGLEKVTASKALSNQELQDIKDLTINIVKEADNDIRHNRFDISPYLINDYSNACKYCKYRDICYVHFGQPRKIQKEKKEDEEAVEA